MVSLQQQEEDLESQIQTYRDQVRESEQHEVGVSGDTHEHEELATGCKEV